MIPQTEAFRLYEVFYAGQEALVDTLVLERMEEKLAVSELASTLQNQRSFGFLIAPRPRFGQIVAERCGETGR